MTQTNHPRWALPYDSPLPSDPKKAGWVKIARVAAYVLLAAAMIVPVIQFQVGTADAQKKLKEKLAKVQQSPKAPTEPIKTTKGAFGRWRKACRQYWDGENIYRLPTQPGQPVPQRRHVEGDDIDFSGEVYLHPNTQLTVILLSPFAYLPVETAALAYNLLKMLAFLATLWMLASMAGHRQQKIPDWVLGLGLLWSILLVMADFQHGNTNTFVLAAIVLHLWLFRKGRDYSAGAALALAVCLKMTPAFFALYWLYQRNWKLLGGLAVAMVIAIVLVPLASSVAIEHGNMDAGLDHYVQTTTSWWENLIKPGLVKGAWYPVHINQSLSGMLSRMFLSGPNGDMEWNPDDTPYYETQTDHGWITLVDLPEPTVKMIFRVCQFVIVTLLAWAIGWRKLPRDDGRRLLHWGLLGIGMLLLNQRTWDEHSAVMLLASAGCWQAITFGRMSTAARKWALALVLVAGPLIWLSGGELFSQLAKAFGKDKATGEHWGNVFKAYGPTFWHFLLMLAAGVLLAVALRKAPDPYATQRQTLDN